jgi:glycerol-3-phosphate dehydrogenase
MGSSAVDFSFRTRETALQRFRDEVFDLLVIGGGITGAAVARDAVSRGLKVALVERRDFAYGTSSRSSKLIHGGLRYLENFEFGLVFEALAERALLLKTMPTMVRPLPFFLPVYEGDKNGKTLLDLGLWLYDLLALFRTPGFHQRLSREKVLEQLPFLRAEGLTGGFRYFDASMWDDVLAVETLRAAAQSGAAVANYVEATGPLWSGPRVSGFRVRDLEGRGETVPKGRSDIAPKGRAEIDVRAHRTVICAGPWADELGEKLSSQWRHWLNPSKGVHLIFDLKRIPVPAAMVMTNPEDGRIAFVIPRPDFGAGVTIVGTTDGPTPKNPDAAAVERGDVEYLMALLHRYFPGLGLKDSDILSAYVGVRPLMGATVPMSGSEGQSGGTGASLQKVSREHHIGNGPGGTVIVAGGKYTTHRKMAEEIVDFTLREWRRELKRAGKAKSVDTARALASHGVPPYPAALRDSRTKAPVNPRATADAVRRCRSDALARNQPIPEELLSRYGADALCVVEAHARPAGAGSPQLVGDGAPADPAGFPMLAAQLRHAIRSELVMHLEDFYLRRVPLYASRADHGLPWAEELARVWAEERGLPESAIAPELARLKAEVERRSAWQKRTTAPF